LSIALPALPYLQDESLARHCTYRIGGPAKYMAFPEKPDHLRALASYLQKSQEPYFIIGNGSNILPPDEGFPGWIISTMKLAEHIVFLSENEVAASASTPNSRLLRTCAEKGLGGIEYLSGVPGNLGGAVWMNAGTAKGWIAEQLGEVTTFSFSQGVRTYSKPQLKYSYREQHFMGEDEIILSATLLLNPEPADTVKARLAQLIKQRKAAQPIELPSCGSVFRNPDGHNAWKLISDAGLRGKKIGGARISEKHCNFIVNEGGATQKDVLALIAEAKARVQEKFGITLQEEVVLLKPKLLAYTG
jgi:UDP-N-acetylmuramate dehydrogenase